MARMRGDNGQAAVLDAGQVRRLIRIAGTTGHSPKDKAIITLS